MNTIQIRKATLEDLPGILEIYAYAKQFMKETGNPHQWAKGGPTQEVLTEDIRKEQLYVIENDTGIHASFMFSLAGERDYLVIEDGSWSSDSPYGVIHRVAGDGQIHGVLKSAVEYGKGFCDHLRIDTHHDNLVMQGAIAKCGFERRGIIYLKDGSPRIAYEWLK